MWGEFILFPLYTVKDADAALRNPLPVQLLFQQPHN